MLTIESINCILYNRDPMQIVPLGVPNNEYMPEANRLHDTLHNCDWNIISIQHAVYNQFVDAFSHHLAGNIDQYANIAQDIYESAEVDIDKNCAICTRIIGDVNVQDHHLIPKELGGKETIPLHKMCHQKIHATFTNRELLHKYHTPDIIRTHPEMIKFIEWIKNKDPSFYLKNDDTASRHRQR